MNQIVHRLLGPLLVAVPLSACDLGTAARFSENEGGDGGAFQFALVEGEAISIQANSSDGPIAGARVLVHAPGEGDAGFNEVVWIGLTDQHGKAEGKLARKIHVSEVEITVEKPGWRGPYTDERGRAAFGPFGPAAWIRTPANNLSTVTLALSRTESP